MTDTKTNPLDSHARMLTDKLAQAEQEITAYDMTMNRQSKLIAELQAQLEAVGAGGAGGDEGGDLRRGPEPVEVFANKVGVTA